MANTTGNSSVNSSIRQNTSSTNEGFAQLLQLQQISNEYLSSIQNNLIINSPPAGTFKELLISSVNTRETLKTMLDYADLSADRLKELTIASENTNQTLNSMFSAMQSIADSLKSSSPTIQSNPAGSPVLNSNTSTALAASSKENKNEGEMAFNKQMAILEKIELNTREAVGDVSKPAENKGGMALGRWLTALAVAIGSIVGVISAQLKAIKFFFDAFGGQKLVASIRKSLASFLAGVSMTFDLVKATISEKFSAVVKFFDSVINSIKTFISGEGKIAKFLSSVTSTISKIMTPFMEAFVVIKDFFMVTGSKFGLFITETFGKIAASLGKFTGLIGTVAKIVGKIFLPLTIILTLWDTVKGAIEGYGKDGIVGAIAGAIKGFFNSLIFSLLDLVKDAISYVLGVFGFDKVKEYLDRIKFEETFSMLIDGVKDMIFGIKDWILGIFDTIRNITIPAISINLPKLLGGPIKAGPWKPFGGSNSAKQDSSTLAPDAPPAGDAAKPAAKPAAMATGRITSREELKTYSDAYEKARADGASVKKAKQIASEHVEAVKGRKAVETSDIAPITTKANIAPSPASTGTPSAMPSAQQVTRSSSDVIAAKESADSRFSSSSIIAPSTTNNMNQTQVAKIQAPIRNSESSLDRYFRSRAVY